MTHHCENRKHNDEICRKCEKRDTKECPYYIDSEMMGLFERYLKFMDKYYPLRNWSMWDTQT